LKQLVSTITYSPSISLKAFICQFDEIVQKRIRRTDFFYLKLNTLFYCLTLPSYLIFVWYINLEKSNFYNILAFHNKEKLYEYIATNGFLSVAQENLAEAVPVEKTLSISNY
jgi:hypothetical protein